MFTNSRRIVVLSTILIIAAPFAAPEATADVGEPTFGGDEAELANFVRDIVDASPGVQAARAALDASAAYEAAAGRPLYNPELELDAEDADSKVRTFGLSHTFDWGGKRRARLSVAEAERLSMSAEYTVVRWQVSVELLTALAGYQTETERTALAGNRITAMQEFAAIAGQRFDSGDISQIDLDLAVLALMQARMQQATAAASLAESRQAVSNLVVGAQESRWPEIGIDLPAAIASTGDVQETVMALPQVRAAQLSAEAARARVLLRQRERRVDPTLSVRGGKEDDESLIGVSVTIPLPVRNSLRHEVTAASAEYRLAQQVLSGVSRRAYTRFLGAQERYQISLSAWQGWRKTGDVRLQSQGDLLRRLWEAGELSTTDYLVQLTQTLDTAESALELRGAMWRAWFEWMIASGQIENWLGAGA